MIDFIKKFMFSMVLLGASQAAYAEWTQAGNVTKVQLGSAGDLFITTTAPLINPAGCTASTYFISASYEPFNKYYASLLTAKAAGTPVKLFISDTACNGAYPLIQGMTNE